MPIIYYYYYYYYYYYSEDSGEMIKWLKVLVALAKDPILILSTHIVIHNHL